MDLINNNTDQEILLIIKEITRGSQKKYYAYKIKRFKLPDPQAVFIGGSYITYKYKNNIKRTNLPDDFINNKSKPIFNNVTTDIFAPIIQNIIAINKLIVEI